MTITVAKLKRALEETAAHPSQEGCLSAVEAIELVLHNPHTLTILAEKLSERPASLGMDNRTGVVSEPISPDPQTQAQVSIIIAERDERPLTAIIEHGARASREGW